MKKSSLAFVALLASGMFLESCKSKKVATAIDSGEEIEVIIPCSGEEYKSDEDFIRATSMGESQDLTLAKKKARNNTLQELAGKIQTTVQVVVDNYQNSTETQDGEVIQKRYEELTREVIEQKISNYITACEKLTKTKNGSYRSYLAYEIKVDDLLTPLSDKINQDEILRVDYNYEKFKKTFHDALKNQ
ncbi:hypothetical protein [Aureibacter tunicatorum]|uniref:Uncharacterized protein (DUF433 family) n=1 Tax=Aureibacter tunicatorum TaxID=866807 RepID=A0AAE3XKX1_9BACT|nr:hypothetical protein [Aureibacter tunicatorum]MDR6237631.1 uncharacterized protein (DUF433 family) [Aureibacter tunicatorum]BDD02666.1 hypothetical protein AUTU_01490 [Aureibacter tunicatorum]